MDGQAEITWVAHYIPRWFNCPQTVTITLLTSHDRATTLIKTDLLLLSQTATLKAFIKEVIHLVSCASITNNNNNNNNNNSEFI